jgi:hypothetical protein
MISLLLKDDAAESLPSETGVLMQSARQLRRTNLRWVMGLGFLAHAVRLVL